MTLVDSSVWIAAWRGEDARVVGMLTRLVEATQVVINPLIKTELLQGARDARHQQHLRNLLVPIFVESLPDAVWDEAPKLYLRCREKGITLTTIDCLIATHAIIGRHTLWSRDEIFAKTPGLRLAPV